jgi:hypothetical protein
LKVGGNGFGGQATTTLAPESVISSGNVNGNGGFSISVGQGVQTGIRGNDDQLEQDRKNHKTFMDNHGGGNAMRNTINYNPSATYRSPNIGPIENQLSNAQGPCVFGICTDLDPNHAPGVKSYRSKLMYPTIVGVKRVSVNDGYKYKELGIPKIQVADDGPLEEECVIDKFDLPNDIWCKEPLKYQHIAGDSVFGKIKNKSSLTPWEKLFKKYAKVENGHFCDTPIKTIEECSEAGARLEFADTHAVDDYQVSSSSDPPWCYSEEGKLKFNSNGGNIGRCTPFDICLCKVVAGTGVASFTEYEALDTGKCPQPIRTKKECQEAAIGLQYKLGITIVGVSAIEDYQDTRSTDPPFCYYEDNTLKFNSNGGNTGDCSATDRCFCIKPKPGTPGAPLPPTSTTKSPKEIAEEAIKEADENGQPPPQAKCSAGDQVEAVWPGDGKKIQRDNFFCA